jgi:hypothetical protein
MLNDLVARTLQREILEGSGYDHVGVGQFLGEHCRLCAKRSRLGGIGDGTVPEWMSNRYAS